MEVSIARANRVANQLIRLIGDASRVELVLGAGETEPLDALPSESPWQRRVTLYARTCPDYRG